MHLEAWESGKPLLALKFELLQKPEVESKKLRPVGLKEGLILESSLMIPYVAEVLKPAWHWTEEACGVVLEWFGSGSDYVITCSVQVRFVFEQVQTQLSITILFKFIIKKKNNF